MIIIYHGKKSKIDANEEDREIQEDMSVKIKGATLAIVKYILHRGKQGKFFGNRDSVKMMFSYYSQSLINGVFDNLMRIGFLEKYKGEIVSFYYINTNKMPCEKKELKSVALPEDMYRRSESRNVPKDDCMFHRFRGCYGARR